MRFNPGGWDLVSLEIYRRFITKKETTFVKKAKYNDGFTLPQSIFVNPSSNPFHQKVILLTGPQTASASEVFIMSTLGNDRFLSIGGSTMGIFSDVLSKKLPNGWTVNLSNEIYSSANGKVFESHGIEPDINVGYSDDVIEFYKTFSTEKKDIALAKALELLKK